MVLNKSHSTWIKKKTSRLVRLLSGFDEDLGVEGGMLIKFEPVSFWKCYLILIRLETI